MDWCTGLHDTGLVATVQNEITAHFLDGQMEWCIGFYDADLAIMVQNGKIVLFLTDSSIAMAYIIQILLHGTK